MPHCWVTGPDNQRPTPGGAGMTGTGGGLGIVTPGGSVTVTVLVLVLARVDGVVGGVDGPTGTPGMISVEVTVVLVLDVGFDGGGDSPEQALAPRAAAATAMTTTHLNILPECPVI